MQQPLIQSKTTLISTTCGTLLSVFNNVSTQDLIKTAVLAAVGASVSFIVSVALKLLFRKFSKKQRPTS